MKYTVSIEIAKPREEVAQLLADPAHMPKWLRGLVLHEPLSGVHGQVGTKSRVVMQMGQQKFEATEQTRTENVIESYNYTKRNIDLSAVVDMAFRITDQAGNVIEASVPTRKEDHKAVVVLDNVKPEDTQGVKKQGTEPDEVQFLTDQEIQARDLMVKAVREKALVLPSRILAEARRRAQQGDFDGAAEEYILYSNAVGDSASQEREEAAKFLHDHFNLNPASAAGAATLRAMN